MRKQITTLNEGSGLETREYSISGDPRILDQVEKLLTTIQFLGHVGASRDIVLGVDGDGAARIRVRLGKSGYKKDLPHNAVDTDQNSTNMGIG